MPWIQIDEATSVYITRKEVDRREERRRRRAAMQTKLDVATMGDQPSCWPMECWNAGVNPEQISEQMAYDKKMGVGATRYTPTGEPILTDKSHYKRYMRANGLYSRNAGYSDPEPVNR